MIRAIFVTFLLGCICSQVHASELKINVAQLPIFAETKDKGLLVELLRYLERTSTETKISYSVMPFSRSVEGVKRNEADIHMPIIEATGDFPLALSTYTLFNVQFSIYSLKSNPITKDVFEDIKGMPYLSIETDMVHTKLFKRPLEATFCLKCSVQKLSHERIDGLIYAAPIINDLIKRDGIKDIVEVPYIKYPVKYAFARSEAGRAAAQKLEQIMQSKQSDSQFVELMNRLNYNH